MAELNSLKVDGITELNSLTINEIGILDLITNSIYPIGSIYISVNDTNPSTLFGGKWIAWGSGKVPVGVNTSDTEFSTVEKTGGSKTHAHTYSHTHDVPGVAHTHTTGNHTLTVAEIPSHDHSYTDSYHYFAQGSGAGGEIVGSDGGLTSKSFTYTTDNTGGNGAHNHGNTGSTTPSATTTNSQSATNTSSVSNIQPYITCYMWKRIE